MTKGSDEKFWIDPQRWVDEHGDVLYRYAMMRIRNTELAEDLVQETFLNAIQSVKSYKWRSSVRTWLIGILKNKIYDYYRRESREIPLTQMDKDEISLEDELGYFNQEGMWQNHKPNSWSNPKEALDQKEFWMVFEKCNDGLPQRLRDAFTLRELESMRSDEVCQVLNVTSTNFWKMMHRARVQLRQCLEDHWFGRSSERI